MFVKKITILWVFLLGLAVEYSNGIKTILLENICGDSNSNHIRLSELTTGILKIDRHESWDQHIDCEVVFIPRSGSSVILSFFRYALMPGDELTITDVDKHKISLHGEANFQDERKSYSSDGLLTLHYFSNNTSYHKQNGGFQLTFTQARARPCYNDEFKCKNHRCIDRKLACDGHNHCGDNSDQENCVPQYPTSTTRYVRGVNYTAIILTVIGGVALIVIIVLTSIYIARRRKAAKAKEHAAPKVDSGNVPPATVHTISTRDPTSHHHQEEHHQKAEYQVPPLYPHLSSGHEQPPTAPDFNDGHTNENFASDE